MAVIQVLRFCRFRLFVLTLANDTARLGKVQSQGDDDTMRTRTNSISLRSLPMKYLVAFILTCGMCLPALAQDNKAKLEEYFKKLDKDGDGKLTLAEFKGKAEGDQAAKAEARFKKMDTNSDGSLSLAEFIAGVNAK